MRNKNNSDKAEHFVVWGSTKKGMSYRSDKIAKNNKDYLGKICAKMSKFLKFEFDKTKKSGSVGAKRGNQLLGRIEYCNRRRHYIFVPEEAAVYSVGCLRDIAEFIEGINAQPQS